MYKSKYTIAIPPGYTIKEQLEIKGMMQKEFAKRMDLSEKHISQLINGKVELTQDVALRLEYVLGIPANFWNSLESIYREKLKRAEEENELQVELSLLEVYPYRKMMELGWVEGTKDNILRVFNLRRYFEVAKLDVIDNLTIPGIAYREVSRNNSNNYVLAAWAQKARIESRNYEVSNIDIERLKDLVPAIRSLTVKSPEEFCPELNELLKSCGVVVVFLPHLDGSFLHGASFVEGNKIVLGLTVRGVFADKFWFSLFHEIYHIISGHIFGNQVLTEEFEREADCFARDTLISLDDYKKLIKIENYDSYIVNLFARSINIAPGIVVGRLQKDNIIGYNRLNQLRDKYIIDN